MNGTLMALAAAGSGSSVPTVGEALALGTDRLRDAGVASGPVVAGWLLADIAGCARLVLSARAHEPLDPAAWVRFRRRLDRAARGEPMQYVLGETDFLGHRLRCDARALIPRPETEELTAQALADLASGRVRAPCIVDVGTGSGCIALALASALPRAEIAALDADPAALALARENARDLGLDHRIRFRRADLLDGWPGESADLVIANLPYISSADCERLPATVRDHEPRQALDGGPDGLQWIGTLVRQAAGVLRPGGLLYLEIGMEQGVAVHRLLTEAGFTDVAIRPDRAGRDRMARGIRAGPERTGTGIAGASDV